MAVITFEMAPRLRFTRTTLPWGRPQQRDGYLSNAVIQANLTPNTAVVAYTPEAAVWGEAYITEKVETKAGWQFPSPEEDWMRGYPQELEDFVDAIRDGRPPRSGAALARDVVEVIYAGYLSAATGRRVELTDP